MALDLTSGPYSGAPGIDQAFWIDMAQLWLRTGVIRGKLLEFLVFADSSGRQVKVRTGWAWVLSQFAKHTTDNYVLPIVANASGITRFDYVILKNDFVAKTVTLTTKEGSAGVLPTLQDDASAFEYALASVVVTNGAVTIAAGDVTNQRTFVSPGGRGLHLIDRRVLSAAATQIDFTGIPQTYDDLELEISARGDTAAASTSLLARFNADVGANYAQQNLFGVAGTPSASEVTSGATGAVLAGLPAATAPAGSFAAVSSRVPRYAGAQIKLVRSEVTYYFAVGTGGRVVMVSSGWWTTAAINAIRLYALAGNLAAGTVASLWGRGA